MPDPFITVGDLSDQLGIDLSQDPGAAAAVADACDVCREVAELDFAMGTATISLDGTGGDSIVLPQYPVHAVDNVSVNGDAVTDFSFTEDGMLFRGLPGTDPRPSWPLGRQNVVVTYEYGYETVEVPGAVRRVALDIAARYAVQGMASSESLGGASISYSTPAGELSSNEERILLRYRRTRSF